ncbi:inositol monophosphatase family protein [Arthrobacter sp.]|uniref:inositol monophosphatase family protein n=1 Tax=Arthrobacter sp. TaxID=1667 RepID=UPI0026E097A4|nr:inositol monophosphatase family protein [Arthrobacter sp.]MDO5752774.1 inositol monophosphatase family protein [Arthrobacter sp.]
MATETIPAPSDSELAAKLLRAAGALAVSIRAKGLQELQAGRQIKANAADFATAADLAAEKFLYEQLRLARPEDSILGEEGAGFEGSSGRVWVVDPVDGTFNFASGSTYWCSALALVTGVSGVDLRSTAVNFAHAEVLLGAIYQPEEEKMWMGGSQHQATCNGQLISVDSRQQVGELAAGSYIHPGWLADPRAAVPWQRAAVLPATLRMLGSGSCDLARVGQGELGVWFQHSCPSWDWLPGKGVVEAAGGDTAVVPVNGLEWFVAGPAGAVAELKAALEQGAVPA